MMIEEIHRAWTIGDGVFCVFCEEEKKRREMGEGRREKGEGRRDAEAHAVESD
jgi:hypothetical protein